jgi:hypothetical protein
MPWKFRIAMSWSSPAVATGSPNFAQLQLADRLHYRGAT